MSVKRSSPTLLRIRRWAQIGPSVAALVIASAAFAPAALAQVDPVIEIPLNTQVRAPEGTSNVLAEASTPPELVGLSCPVNSQAANNGSVHPGNDLVVSSGTSQIVLLDVEGASGKVTASSTALTLGPTVVITLIMGPDRVFSAGASAGLTIDCTDAPTAPTSTTTTTTTAPVSPATSEPPVDTPQTTSSVPTAVLPQSPVSPAAIPIPGQPTFTG